jgi:hypothetical protein
MRALEVVRAHAEAVAEERPVETFAAAEFAREVLRVARAPFPLRHASAQAAQAAFLAAARALISADRPVDRRALALIAQASAEAIDALLNDDRAAQAQAWMRQVPERDR